jgi:hypothetical protein
MGKTESLALVLFLVLSLAGCRTRTDTGCKVEGLNKPPEVGPLLSSGPVLLNVAGAGFRRGDVVRIKTQVAGISRGDVILFDWRKAAVEPGGVGPAQMIGQVIGLPGDRLAMSTFLKYRGRDGKRKDAWFSTFERRGAKNYDDNITLPSGDYLVETERNILIVGQSSIGARVVKRLGHDDEAEKEMQRRVY